MGEQLSEQSESSEPLSLAGRDTRIIARLVNSSLHHDIFEYIVSLFYPDRMDEQAKLSLITAINHNMSKTRRDYFLEKYGFDIEAPCSPGLNCIPEDELVAAKVEINSKNRKFEVARQFIEEYDPEGNVEKKE
ncbi:hypothetical protein JXB28_01660 [Candidatus Woesearchaeota archaeon]|nr:hypothetical protein [Candidatus Woesearchaeota archaeon]